MSTHLRTSRLFDRESGNASIIALANSFYYGPVGALATTAQFRDVLRGSIDGGADALMLTPGSLKANLDLLGGRDRPGIILSAGYTNAWRTSDLFGHDGLATEQALFASVEEAVRLGADAYHVYAFLGYSDSGLEAREIQRVGHVLERAHGWGLPVLCEPLVRGDAVAPGDANRVEYVALAARLLSEVGADLIKVEYTGSPESFATVVEASFAPVIMMGGAATNTFDEFLTSVTSAIASGSRGLAVGRNVYGQSDVAGAVAAITAIVHGTAGPTSSMN